MTPLNQEVDVRQIDEIMLILFEAWVSGVKGLEFLLISFEPIAFHNVRAL